ncbi:hypothetical protein Tco_0850535 [Tanacetum coccineum]
MDYGLEYSGDPSVLEGYTDASWITDQEYYASTSGWIFTLGGGAVSWGSKKQSCLTDSTMAAEFVALASCYKEAEWLRDLLINIPLWTKPMPPISVYCDSQSTLSRSYKQVYNAERGLYMGRGGWSGSTDWCLIGAEQDLKGTIFERVDVIEDKEYVGVLQDKEQ